MAITVGSTSSMELFSIAGSFIVILSLLALIVIIISIIVNRIRKRPLKRLIVSASLLPVVFILGIAIILGNTPTNEPADSSLPGANDLAQVWQLTNDTGDVATVTVSPFTNSGTFTETSDSTGWFIHIPGLTYRLQVGGNIVHTGSRDRWTFVGLTGVSGNTQTLGQGEGTTNGLFPDASAVSGTITLTTRTPIGTQTGTAKWWGNRIK